MPNYRSNQFAIGLTVEGLPEGKQTDKVRWDSLEGGDNTVEGTNYLPGGMAPLVALGGIPKRSALTLKRAWSTSLIEVFKALDQAAGQCPATITVATLKANGEVVENAPVITYTGVLGTVTRPNYAAETGETAYLQVVVDPNGPIS